MESIFLKLFNMSISAVWLILAVILLRLLFKKAPKYMRCILWGLVGIRLVFPFSIESIISLIPSAETVPSDIMYDPSPTIHSGIYYLNSAVNPIISESLAPTAENSINPMQIVVFIASIVWIVGIAAMLIYGTVSYLRLRRKVAVSINLQDNLYLCDNISSPFILGIFRPKIYLPSDMNEEQLLYVTAHEKAHLKRLDHISKPLGFILFCIYWFNPFVWLAYYLFCRDIELACDEKAIADMDTEQRKGYSLSLLSLSLPRHMLSACPLAFGEVGVKSRVKSVLSFKKPAIWVIIAAIIVCAIVAVCFLTDPVDKDDLSDVEIYTYHDSVDFLSPQLLLNKVDGTFTFNYSGFSSYIAHGKYELDGNTLTLNTYDGMFTYVFKVKGDSYAFDADKSSEIPKYRYSEGAEPECPVPDGAVFVSNIENEDEVMEEGLTPYSSQETGGYLDSIVADIDGDGIDEVCRIVFGTTSGVFTFMFYAYENDDPEYFNIFESEFYYLSFSKSEDSGEIKVQGITQGENPEIHYFDISVENSNIVLSENGKRLDYWGEQGLNSDYFQTPSTVKYSYLNTGMKLNIPDDWDYSIIEHGEDPNVYGISFWPKESPDGKIDLYYHLRGFGVCGTGLSIEECTLESGLSATLYTYNNSEAWSFMHFNNIPGDYVASINCAQEWWDEYSDEVMAILNTTQLGEGV